MIDQYLRVRYWFLHFRKGTLHTVLWAPCPSANTANTTTSTDHFSVDIFSWRGPEDLQVTLVDDEPGWTHAAKVGRHLVISVGMIGKKAFLTRKFRLEDIKESTVDLQNIIQRVPDLSCGAFYVSEHGTYPLGPEDTPIRGSREVNDWNHIDESSATDDCWCNDINCTKTYDWFCGVYIRRCPHFASYAREGDPELHIFKALTTLYAIDARRLLCMTPTGFHIHDSISKENIQSEADANGSWYTYRRCGAELIRFSARSGAVSLETLVERGGVFSWAGFEVDFRHFKYFQLALTFYH
jgi:hypothetical protein